MNNPKIESTIGERIQKMRGEVPFNAISYYVAYDEGYREGYDKGKAQNNDVKNKSEQGWIHVYRTVSQEETCITKKLRVQGGWIYRTETASSVAMVFVGD